MKPKAAASERPASLSAPMDEAGVDPQRDIGARGSRSAPAWEADAKFTGAETDETREDCADAADGARRFTERIAEGTGKPGIACSETFDQPAKE